MPYWESINIFVKIINGIELKHSEINSLWRTGMICLSSPGVSVVAVGQLRNK